MRTDCGIEDINSVGPIIIEGFIHNIPTIALPFVMSDLVCNMVLHCRNESSIRPGTGRYWKRQRVFF